ncbi:TetR/AcrR family transcriptional regulator [Nocardioides acrostichi]|uniref:TetR/AcrR family transcriptional regulator n=1 Tax=Nocardioides acrostichi TaxID=2784339 RepID=A0A930YAH5_9ACTN|nr:TetR/AcrR family transcriptional regulator [Nocardioides acrostichi]MBF4161408.1 TetR/AcrR family transcriptional regulator [Nocardioides acrostichi]
MRTHGWAGQTPTDDAEAVERIMAAAERVAADGVREPSIARVARAVGVTRQTVYRYFPTSQALVAAVALRSADGLLARIERRFAAAGDDPVAAYVDGIVLTLETIGQDPRLTRLLFESAPGEQRAPVLSETGMAFARSFMQRLDVDWVALGHDVDEVAELGLRVLHSLLHDPGNPPRAGAELRTFVDRWLGAALRAPADAPRPAP